MAFIPMSGGDDILNKTLTRLKYQSCSDTSANAWKTFTITNPVSEKTTVEFLLSNHYGNTGYTTELRINGTTIFSVNDSESTYLYGMRLAHGIFYELNPTDTITVYTRTVQSKGGGADLLIFSVT